MKLFWRDFGINFEPLGFLLLASYLLLHPSYFLLLTPYFLLPTSYFLLPTSYFLLLTSALALAVLAALLAAPLAVSLLIPAERARVLLFSQLLRELLSINFQAILKPIEALPSTSKRRGERAQRASEAPGERTLKGEMTADTTRADNRTPKRKPRPQDHTT